MYNYLSNFIKKISLKRKCSFGRMAFINGSSFEGNNYIGVRTKFIKSSLGYSSYIGNETQLSQTDVGRFTSIGSNVKLICGTHPTEVFVSTHPAFYSPQNTFKQTFAKEKIFEEHKTINHKVGKRCIIGNDVWICDNVLILEGVSIGDGAIIAAGSVVVKDVEPYSIIGGVPAKIIKKRFDEKTIDFLLQIKWWNKDEKWLSNNWKYFSNINCFVDLIKKDQHDE